MSKTTSHKKDAKPVAGSMVFFGLVDYGQMAQDTREGKSTTGKMAKDTQSQLTNLMSGLVTAPKPRHTDRARSPAKSRKTTRDRSRSPVRTPHVKKAVKTPWAPKKQKNPPSASKKTSSSRSRSSDEQFFANS